MTATKKINIFEYFSVRGMATEVAHLSGSLKATQIRSALHRARRGNNISPTTKRLVFEGINKQHGGKLIPTDIVWSSEK